MKSETKQAHTAYKNHYKERKNWAPLVPESFVARTFLSRRPIQLLDSYEFENKKIIDLGCGKGRHISFFLSLGFKVSGTEVSHEQTQELKKEFPQGDFKTALSDNVPWGDNTFDFFAAINSIYYLNKPKTLQDNLKEACRLLQPGGVFLLSFVGNEHFILKNSSIQNNEAMITSDPLFFRNKTYIHSVSSTKEAKETIEKNSGLKVSHIGEVRDTCAEYCRHLYYAIGQKPLCS